MARYTGPMTKKSRRLKTDLVGGDQAFERRPFPPGQHGRARTKEKEYLTQLQEKQKARFTYGVMEKQFRRYYAEAASRPGKTGETLLQILESRLDNVVYRAGFGDRPTPAWLKVVPESLTILIHSLPVRAQIDSQVTEQLIVEFYSK